jgi:hypothetical protein
MEWKVEAYLHLVRSLILSQDHKLVSDWVVKQYLGTRKWTVYQRRGLNQKGQIAD